MEMKRETQTFLRPTDDPTYLFLPILKVQMDLFRGLQDRDLVKIL